MKIEVSAKLDTRGFDRVLKHGPARMDDATRKVAEELRDDIRAHWSPASPSSPGEPPAVVSGALHRSARVRPSSAKGWVMKYKVVFEVGHGKYLEKGTGRMAERPFLKPAIKRARRNMRKHYLIMFKG
jgi:hypothetical protein